MRTVLFLTSGVLLLAATVILSRLFGESFPAAANWAAASYLLLWLGLTGTNMWAGVSRAGYAVADELPIFLLLFGLPAVALGLLKWKVF